MESKILEELSNAILIGDHIRAVRQVSKALGDRMSARDIISRGLSRGMVAAGKKYNKKGMYLDSIIRSARAFEAGLNVLTPQLEKERTEMPSEGKVVLGVMGGPWSIGKKVVEKSLVAEGFEVFDAGSDVSPQIIAKRAVDEKANIVASAIFLAHTVPLVGDLEQELKNLGIRHKIRTIVSGPGASKKVAEAYGVDVYAKDVIEVLSHTKKFMEDIKTEMTPMQRVMTSLQLKEPDRVPFVPFTQLYTARFSGVPYSIYCSKAEAMAEAEIKAQRFFGYDQVNAASDLTREAEACGAKVVFPYDDVPRIVKPAIRLGRARKDFQNLKMPDPVKTGRMAERVKTVELLKKEVGEEVPVIGWTEGPVQGTGILLGADESFVLLSQDDPDLFSEIVDWYVDLEFEFAKAQIDAGADIIGSGEAAGFFCSPEFYVKFGLQADKKVYKKIRDYGAPVLLHCCGYVPQCIKYAPDVNAGGVIQIDYNVDLAWAKSLIGDKIAIMGNLDGNRVLAAGSEEDVEKACIRAVKEAGKGGGYMLSAGCEIPRDTPNQNMAMMMKVVRTFGKYPIRVS